MKSSNSVMRIVCCVSIALIAFLHANSHTMAQSGTNLQASVGEDGRWSVRELINHLDRVKLLSDGLLAAAGDHATCHNELQICQNIQSELAGAYDHAYYVFHYNTNFSGKCLYRRLDNLIGWAGRINYWNNWLWQRSYNAGLADMAQQIRDYQHLPPCPPPKPPPVNNTAPATVLSENCDYYRARGHQISTPKSGVYAEYCAQLTNDGKPEWVGGSDGWACLSPSGDYLLTIDPVEMCLRSHRVNQLGVCFNPDRSNPNYLYSPQCVFQ